MGSGGSYVPQEKWYSEIEFQGLNYNYFISSENHIQIETN